MKDLKLSTVLLFCAALFSSEEAIQAGNKNQKSVSNQEQDSLSEQDQRKEPLHNSPLTPIMLRALWSLKDSSNMEHIISTLSHTQYRFLEHLLGVPRFKELYNKYNIPKPAFIQIMHYSIPFSFFHLSSAVENLSKGADLLRISTFSNVFSVPFSDLDKNFSNLSLKERDMLSVLSPENVYKLLTTQSLERLKVILRLKERDMLSVLSPENVYKLLTTQSLERLKVILRFDLRKVSDKHVEYLMTQDRKILEFFFKHGREVFNKLSDKHIEYLMREDREILAFFLKYGREVFHKLSHTTLLNFRRKPLSRIKYIVDLCIRFDPSHFSDEQFFPSLIQR